ncbi:MAG TPA: flagellar hook-basal body complex protein [Pseudoduganella sp.]|jgi:flagellar hook protein FlgE
MFESISIGTSSLLGHEKGLRTVGNNLANVNTAGFKSSQLGFTALFDQQAGGGQAGANGGAGGGTGVKVGGSVVNFQAGLDQSTGNPTDLKINGNGFFVIKRGNEYLYTRAGDFSFNDKGVLVNGAGDTVQAMAEGGKLADLELDKQLRSPAKATTTLKFAGVIPSPPAGSTAALADVTLPSITAVDANGSSHTLSMKIHYNGSSEYALTVSEGATTVGTGTLKFAGAYPVPGFNAVTMNWTPAGLAATSLKFDFSSDVMAQPGASTIAFASQDGYAAGAKSDQTIGADGVVTIKYSNGQTSTGPRLALADFASVRDLSEAGGSAFRRSADAVASYGYADTTTFGKLQVGHREGSNVDLAEEFSNLILMQRGYQAASHVVSTANEMIQQLFEMKR